MGPTKTINADQAVPEAALVQAGKNVTDLQSTLTLSTTSRVSTSSAYLLRKLKDTQTEHKLNFSALGVVGRSKEIELLDGCFSHAGSSTQFVLVGGPAGSGKSVLADRLRETNKGCPGIFAYGKNTLTQQDQPYGAIAQACNQICKDLQKEQHDSAINVADVKAKLKASLGTEALTLLRILPDLEPIIGRCQAEPVVDVSHVEERNRLNLSLRKFLRALGSFGPVVLTIDDLQWADLSSMDLLEHLLRDPENTTLMVVGCFRDNEVDDSHIFTKMITSVKKNSKQAAIEINQVTLGDLSAEAVHEMLLALVGSEATPATQDLAQVVHAKTTGNAFYSVQFFSSLADEHMLSYDETKSEWIWDLEHIKLTTTATANVVELMQAKLKTLPTHARYLTQLASCLGTVVDTDVFQIVIDDYYTRLDEGVYFHRKTVNSMLQLHTYTMEAMLEISVSDGFLVPTQHQRQFRWVHDKIEVAAFELISERRRDSIQSHIGELLFKKLNQEQLDQHLFVVVRLLNAGAKFIPTTNSDKRIFLAELNMKAGKKSVDSSSFSAASAYFRRAVKLMPSNRWRIYRDLSLELYSSAAEAEYCIGSMDKMADLCREVMNRSSDVPLMDKRRVYTTLIAGLNAQRKPEQATEICLDILEQLKCKIPQRFVMPRIVPGFLSAKSNVDKYTPTDLSRWPVITEPGKLWVLELLDRIFYLALAMDRPELIAASVAKSFQWTLKYGLCEASPTVFARLSLVMSVQLGAPHVGIKYADYAVFLRSVYQSKRNICRINPVVYALVSHWSRDLEVKTMLQGYEAGMAIGATEDCGYLLHMFLENSIHLGAPLAALERDCEFYLNQMEELAIAVYNFALMCWQVVANLTGSDAGRAVLSGSLISDEAAFEEEAKKDQALITVFLRRYQMYVCFIFEDFERLFALREECSEALIESSSPGFFGNAVMNFFNALAAISKFRETKKRKYRTIALSLQKKIIVWVNNGNPNVVHYSYLLDAEMQDLMSNPLAAASLYEKAIARTVERNVIQDKGIVHQRMGEFYLRQGNDSQAEHHILQAVHCFEEWGALGKTAQLREKYPSMLQPSSRVCDL